MILRRTPDYARLFSQYFFYLLKFKFFKTNRCPNIFVQLSREDMGHEGRWLFLLLYFLAYGGEKVTLIRNILNFTNYYRLGKYGRLIFKLKHLGVLNQLPSPDPSAVLVSDVELPENEKKKWRRFIFIDYDLEKTREETGQRPYIILNPRMHPLSYIYNTPEKIAFLRESPRTLRLFFSGNIDKKTYSGNPITDKFNILPRYQIIQILKTLPKNSKVLIESEGQRTPFDKWLPALAKCDFFLCPPASHMPWSHNAVEAMAVGAIPFINYPGWFNPPLEHKINCVAFSSEIDLLERVKEILAMKPEEIKIMRENVIEYYEEFLSPSAFLKSLKTIPGDELAIFYNVEDSATLRNLNEKSAIFG